MNEFVESMAQVVTGVTVVTVKDERDDVGVTVATFTSLSLDPPLVMVSLDDTGYRRPATSVLRCGGAVGAASHRRT